MNLRQAAHGGSALLHLLVGRHRPLFASWNLTFRCNRRCSYCGADRMHTRVLDTRQVVSGITSLARAGTRYLTLSGGEPLLREDLGILIRHARRRGLRVFVSSNGSLVPARLNQLRDADRVTLSLDGPAVVHDAVRGTSAFAETLEAIRACRSNQVPVALQCTLGRHNVSHTGDLLALAREHGLRVMFQPATRWLDSTTEPNPDAPQVEPYRRAIRALLEQKRRGGPIANSAAGLIHLLRWPEPSRLLCGAARYFCCVEPDGRVLGCHQAQAGELGTELAIPSVLDGPESLRTLSSPAGLSGCGQCWCAPVVELALTFSGHPSAVVNAARMAAC